MPGTLDLPRGRIEKIWDAGKVGQEALAYADVLHNLGRYLTGNDTDADDLVQETYAGALRAAAQFTPGTNLKAWLFRILRNTFVSAYRRQRHNPVVGGLDTVTPTDEPVNDNWFQHDIDLDRLRSVVREEGLVDANALVVTGKLLASVHPLTHICPPAATTMAFPCSLPLPPRYVL